jgi:hypothetical protein
MPSSHCIASRQASSATLRVISSLLLVATQFCCLPAFAVDAQNAATAPAADTVEKDKDKPAESPWLLVPIFSANPKLGLSLGALAGYMHYFDQQSRPSIMGVNAQYTSTDSALGGVFARTSFGEDHHRLTAMVVGGRIKNNYDDYLGTGVPLKTEDDLSAVAGRYLYRVKDDWFAGVQALYTNYQVLGEDALDKQVLTVLGITGFNSGGIGAIAQHDSRDSEDNPTKGWYLNLNNIAYRDWIAGSNNFDVYRLELRGYWEHGDRNVFAVRQKNQFTVDAPPAAFAPISLRGYKTGQYLGKNMSSIEGEERWRFAERWTANVFAGVACLYGDGLDCTDSANVYPDFGVGVQYFLKQKEGIVLNLEVAKGKSDNAGIYMKMGYAY